MTSPTLPLSGIRVLDFSKLLPGPLATSLLLDWGAEIIKVESPESPDPTRFYPPYVGDLGVNFIALNSGKTILSADLKTENGRNHIFELVKSVDVLVEQFRPGVMANFGLDYVILKEINPRLIYISITGYGQQGPMAHLAGHDLNYMAISGALALTSDEEGKPTIPGVQVADVAGGTFSALTAIAMALYRRERTGEGGAVDISMAGGVMPFMALNLAHAWAGERLPDNKRTFLSGRLANYNVYACSDGMYIALAALEPKFWSEFCCRAEKPHWELMILPSDEIQKQLKDELAEFFLQRSRDEWIVFFEGVDCCLSPVLLPNEVQSYPFHVFQQNLDPEGFRIKNPLKL